MSLLWTTSQKKIQKGVWPSHKNASTFSLALCSSSNVICILHTDDSRVNQGSRWLHFQLRASFVICFRLILFIFRAKKHHAVSSSLSNSSNTIQGVNFTAFARSGKAVLVDSANRETIRSSWGQPSTTVFILHCANRRQGLCVFVLQFSGRHPSGWVWNALKSYDSLHSQEVWCHQML